MPPLIYRGITSLGRLYEVGIGEVGMQTGWESERWAVPTLQNRSEIPLRQGCFRGAETPCNAMQRRDEKAVLLTQKRGNVYATLPMYRGVTFLGG